MLAHAVSGKLLTDSNVYVFQYVQHLALVYVLFQSKMHWFKYENFMV